MFQMNWDFIVICLFLDLFIYCMHVCVCVCCLKVNRCTLCVPDIWCLKKEAQDSLEVELQEVMSHPASVGV